MAPQTTVARKWAAYKATKYSAKGFLYNSKKIDSALFYYSKSKNF
jgi:hypothetical protein